MKIRKLTPKETTEIKKMVQERVLVTKEIHALMIERLHEAYDNYVRDFKYSIWSPLTFKPVSKDVMIEGITGQPIFQVESPSTLRHVNNEPFDVIGYVWYDTKYRLEAPVDQRLLALSRSSYEAVLKNSDSREFIDILLDYAVQPFELSFENVKLLKNMKSNLEYMKSKLQEIKDELQSNK